MKKTKSDRQQKPVIIFESHCRVDLKTPLNEVELDDIARRINKGESLPNDEAARLLTYAIESQERLAGFEDEMECLREELKEAEAKLELE